MQRLFFLIFRRTPGSTLFPYTTLFRSDAGRADGRGAAPPSAAGFFLLRLRRSEEHTSELQSQSNLVCRLLLEKKKQTNVTLSTNTARHSCRTSSNSRTAAPPDITPRNN